MQEKVLEGKRKKKYKGLVFLFAVAVIAACIPWFLSYLGGVLNQNLALMAVFIVLSPIGWAFALIAIILLVIAFCRGGFTRKRTLLCMAPAVLMVGFCVGWFLPPVGAVTFLQGFEKWVAENIGTAEIQSWMADADKDFWGDRPDNLDSKFYGLETELPDDLPPCFPSAKLQYLSFERSELDGSKIVRLEWGGALGHWGVVIGDSNIKMPGPGVEKVSDSYWEYRRILKPGVYIYDGG